MSKSSVYFSAPPLSTSAPSLRLLWRRHWSAQTHQGMLLGGLLTSISFCSMAVIFPVSGSIRGCKGDLSHLESLTYYKMTNSF